MADGDHFTNAGYFTPEASVTTQHDALLRDLEEIDRRIGILQDQISDTGVTFLPKICRELANILRGEDIDHENVLASIFIPDASSVSFDNDCPNSHIITFALLSQQEKRRELNALGEQRASIFRRLHALDQISGTASGGGQVPQEDDDEAEDDDEVEDEDPISS